MRLCLIANPVSGGDARLRIQRAVDWFRLQGVEVDLLLTEGRGDARRLAAAAKAENYDRMVAAGGDGTLNEVVNGLAPSPLPIAFLPLGTTNVFAFEAGLPKAHEAACQVALTGIPRPVCLGRSGDLRFLLMASAGLDADAVHAVDQAVKSRLGKLAYVTSALACLRRGPLPVFEVCDEQGVKHRACQFLAGNGRYYGGRFSITRDASLFEPRLDICLVAPMSRPRYLITVLALLLGHTPTGVVRFAASRLQLHGDGIPLQLDGDACGHLPCTVSITEGEVQIVFPG